MLLPDVKITLSLEEADCGTKGSLEYKTDLFETIAIKGFLQFFHSLR